MRELAEALVAAGHAVTYLTRRQWSDEAPPRIAGVTVIAVSRDEPLYGADGNRTIGEPLRFGAGVARHLLKHGSAYDVVHTASFPYFSLLAAGAARRRHPYRLVTDWHEVWSAEYWRTYVGGPPGRVAHGIQRACARIPQTAFAFSQLHARRLEGEGLRSRPRVIWEEWADDARAAAATTPAPAQAAATPPHVVFAGRLIAEKQAPLAVKAIVLAQARIHGLTGTIFGDGPERHAVLTAIDDARAHGTVDAPGFVDAEILHRKLTGAVCLLAPTRREGYGLVVVEAAALGVPIVLAAGADNAATELVDDGVNGYVAATDDPHVLADAIVRVHAQGQPLRDSTRDWHRAHLRRVAEQDPLAQILKAYEAEPTARR